MNEPRKRGVQRRTKTNSPTGQSEAQIELRRTLVFRMRAERQMSYRSICDALGKGTVHLGERITFDVSPAQAHRDYWHVMDRDVKVGHDDITRHRASLLNESRQVKEGLVSRGAFTGEKDAAAGYMRALDFEAKLCGLYISQPEPADPDALQQSMAEEVELFLAAVAEVEKLRPKPDADS